MNPSKIDPECRYRDSHEWARALPGLSEFEVGISAHAVHALGDVVFVELPAVGSHWAAGAGFGVVESVKAASELYLPLGGTISAVNPALADNPGLVNADCYGQGWMVRVKADNPGDWDALLDPQAYARLNGED